MAAIKSPSVRVLGMQYRAFPLRALLALLALGTVLGAAVSAAVGPAVGATLVDRPVQWYEDDRRDIPQPAERDPNLLWDMFDDSVILPLDRTLRPGRIVRRIGTLFGGDHVAAAANVNLLDEVPNSTWFTNRIGLYPLTPAEVAEGSCLVQGPDQSTRWTVVSAKTQGVTPGFVIRDGRGDRWLVKFDPPGCLGMTTGAGVICNRILHAAGYNVPADVVVHFRRSDLVLGERVKLKLPGGSKRLMTDADLGAILDAVEALPDGTFRAIASRYIDGVPIGPFDYRGRRRDDPNDRINHQDRRELRGLRILAAWLNHFDAKQHNSLDAYVTEDGRSFVRHYLIDFASTLGAGASGPGQRYGYEFTLDLPAILGRALAVGLHDDAWRHLSRPEGLDEVGYFESELFDPLEFKSLQPNSVFADMTWRDGYWAAKIISAFTDEQLLAIAEQAGFRNPLATSYVARILAERRDKIARQLFDRVAPLDFFRLQDGAVVYRDLGAERDIYPAAHSGYRVRVAMVTADRRPGGWSEWAACATTVVPLPEGSIVGQRGDGQQAALDMEQYPFLAVECQVDRGAGWSCTTRAYFARRSGRIVALER